MKKHLQLILNNVLKEQKNLLYGEDCDIIVDKVDWVKSKNCHIVNITIYTKNIEESVEVHPDGINWLIDAGWPILGRKQKPIVISSLDVKI